MYETNFLSNSLSASDSWIQNHNSEEFEEETESLSTIEAVSSQFTLHIPPLGEYFKIQQQVFQGRTIVPHTGNYGKKEDIPKFIDAQINPFNGGICWGASVLFCKKWLETQSIETVAKEFENGAPYEAALLHTAYESCFFNDLSFDPSQETLWECYNRAENKACSHFNIHIEDPIFFDASPENILNTIDVLPDGAYKLALPTYNALGKQDGEHAVAIIKDDKLYAYDSNTTVGYEEKGENSLVKRLIESYCGNCFDKNNSMIKKVGGFFKRTTNFLLLQSNAPFFGEVSQTFSLNRIKVL